MSLIVSLLLSVILAMAPLGAVAAVVTEPAVIAAIETHQGHAMTPTDQEQGQCPDADCPVEDHATACATQTTHCKTSAHHAAAARLGLERTANAVRWRVDHDAGAGDCPQMDLPPPRL